MNEPFQTAETDRDATILTDHPRRRRLQKRSIVLVLFIVALIIGGYLFMTRERGWADFAAKQQDADRQILTIPPAEVSITSRGFSPQTVTIKKGQAVEWTNKDRVPHQIATDPYPAENGLPGFKGQGPLRPSETFLYTFFETGTFSYHDHLNPDTYRGVVIVE